jgi:hypothetical protein
VLHAARQLPSWLTYNVSQRMNLRDQLVTLALAWQDRFAIAPRITDSIAEFDAAMLVGMSDDEYAAAMRGRTAVSKGYDFVFRKVRYQVKANRPSGAKGSKVTLVSKAKNYDWDVLLWILYDREYRLQEVWRWTVTDYRAAFHRVRRISPADMRQGKWANKSVQPTPGSVTPRASSSISK